MESNQDLEIAGSPSGMKTIFTTSPVSLQQLSAIRISIEIWRCKVNEYRIEGKLKEFNPSSENFSFKAMLPVLPTVIYTVIDKFIVSFGYQFGIWLEEHYIRIFYFFRHYRYPNSILKYFFDFVCDYTGAIDYVRTAERMMRCETVGAHQRFAIACTYFFDDDIRRIWPLVSSNMDLNNIDFSKSPQLYYWICCLRNDMGKIPVPPYSSIEDLMLRKFMPFNRTSIEYFWDRVISPYQTQSAIAIYVACFDDISFFIRIILPKLNDQQISRLINRNNCFGDLILNNLVASFRIDEKLILSFWLRVRELMDGNVFTELVWEMIRCDIECQYISEYDHNKRFELQNCGDLFCEIWTSAPENLKLYALANVTSNNRVDNDFLLNRANFSITATADRKEFKFLSSFLKNATSDQRNRFWLDCWDSLVINTRCKDWQTVMELCFENEDEIAQFKENAMANSEVVSTFCVELLSQSCFDEVNDWASFLFSEVQAARKFKQQLLQSTFLDDQQCDFNKTFIQKSKEFHEFISGAYNDVDVAKNFKNQFVSLPSIQKRILDCASFVSFEQLIKFTELFVSNEEILLLIETRIVDFSKKRNDFLKSKGLSKNK